MLRKIKWNAYAGSYRRSIEARAFALLYNAAVGMPAGDKEYTQRGWEVLQKLKRVTTSKGEEGTSTEERFLSPTGGELVLEAAEFTWIERAITKYREVVTVVNADALIYLDERLAEAPKIEATSTDMGEKK